MILLRICRFAFSVWFLSHQKCAKLYVYRAAGNHKQGIGESETPLLWTHACFPGEVLLYMALLFIINYLLLKFEIRQWPYCYNLAHCCRMMVACYHILELLISVWKVEKSNRGVLLVSPTYVSVCFLGWRYFSSICSIEYFIPQV